jgi:putative inorganic carbon (hco3(-)) transporter
MNWPVKVIRLCLTLVFIIVPLIFLPQTSELFEFNKMVATYILTTVITSAWIIDMILQKRLVFHRTPLDWPILIFLVSQFLSFLFSIDQRTSLLGYYSRFNGGLISLLCYSLLYWSFVTFMDHRSTLKLIFWSLITAVIISIYGILEHFGIDASLWVQDVQNRVFSTLGQPNWLSAYLLALIFIPLSFLINHVTMKQFSYSKLLNGLIVSLLGLCFLFTKSRSGLLAFGIASAVFWGLQLLKNKSNSLKWFLIFNLSFLVISLTFSNALSDYVIKPKNNPTAKITGPALEVGGTESGSIRKIVWTGALRIWKDGPKNFLIGTGPETFTMGYYQHRPVEHNATSEWNLLYNKAHNEFLNYLATTGILGLGSYLFLLAAMFWQLFKNLKIYNSLKIKNFKFKIGEQINNNSLQIALLSGWLTIPITNFWGFSVVIIQILMFLLPAMAISLEQESFRAGEYKKPTLEFKQIVLVLISGSLTLLLFYSIAKYWLADTLYAAGSQRELRLFSSQQDTSYLLSAYRDLNTAFELNSRDPVISSELAVADAYLAALSAQTDTTTSSQLAEVALLLSRRAVSQSPHHPNYYKTQARVGIILSLIDSQYLQIAETALKQAAKISPTDPQIPLNLGVIAKYQNNKDLAQTRFLDALKLKPDYADAKAQLTDLK